MEKTHGKGVLKFAILTTIAIAQADTIASVMLSDIAAAFPDASTMAVQYVMQSAMIGAFAVSLLMSVLTAHFRKKPMILAGLVCMFLGGFIPLVNHSSIAILDFCGFWWAQARASSCRFWAPLCWKASRARSASA